MSALRTTGPAFGTAKSGAGSTTPPVSCGILAALLAPACGSTAGGGAADPGDGLAADIAAEGVDLVAPDAARPDDVQGRGDGPEPEGDDAAADAVAACMRKVQSAMVFP